jgi:phosphatidylglycerol:prolipoprotein diacylglycerol transferase
MFPWTLIAYYLLVSLDCIILLFWVIKRSKQLQKSTESALDITLVLMLSSLIGARLLHVVYEEPQLYRNDLWRIFQVWQGGFVFYGGLLSAIVFGILWLRYKKLELLEWLDFFAPLAAFAYAFGRLSCVLAGCCYGKAVNDLPWAMMNHALNDSVLRHPTQWYAVLWELIVLIVLLVLEKKQSFKKGILFFIWLSLHGLGRIIMEIFRADPRGQLIFSLSISTWISMCLIFVSAYCSFIIGGDQKSPQTNNLFRS